jgi:hypothetical protein
VQHWFIYVCAMKSETEAEHNGTKRCEHQAARDRLARKQWTGSFVLSLAIALFTGITALGVWAQYGALNQTLQQMRIEFQAAQRSYIEPVNQPVNGNPSKMSLNQRLEMPLELLNYGSSPTHAYAIGTIEYSRAHLPGGPAMLPNCPTKWFGPKSPGIDRTTPKRHIRNVFGRQHRCGLQVDATNIRLRKVLSFWTSLSRAVIPTQIAPTKNASKATTTPSAQLRAVCRFDLAAPATGSASKT